ncbi:hypothetical protein SAMN05421824_2349 [Hyunsoonleella jejuensis]|uniref:Uncharacterized protein n=1 Tax=Hyunsoonleella jejuensis TaxID=419940 RepID=A0A1H9J0A0_9FLAO|nr:hypothetical protein SAMN05421824_2349 [Hyunsoonleella jejuensis]
MNGISIKVLFHSTILLNIANNKPYLNNLNNTIIDGFYTSFLELSRF